LSKEREIMMKFRVPAALILIISLFLSVSIGVAADQSAENTVLPKPKIFFPETHFKFSPVLEGTKIVHDFTVQNKGNAILKIERVKTG
jgi:hypothetical protein